MDKGAFLLDYYNNIITNKKNHYDLYPELPDLRGLLYDIEIIKFSKMIL